MDPINTVSVGPLRRMVGRELARIGRHYEVFCEAWDRRDIGNAVITFERFREAVRLHMTWEEETLLAEYEKQCRVRPRPALGQHRRQHQITTLLLDRVGQLLARRMGLAAAIDEELTFTLHELDDALCSHRESELSELCLLLDALLSDTDLAALAGIGPGALPG